MGKGKLKMYTWEMDLAIRAFESLEEDQILICSALDEKFHFLKYKYEIGRSPPDVIHIKEQKYIMVIIYHHVKSKQLDYLMKLCFFYVPATEKFNVNSACCLMYPTKKQRRKK
ncbi:MAG: hypothetical protein CL605_00135 [Altibacter sp.]|nr:hypothetical protein [Altibacter sp.]|tara:strand:- start:76 stop:414 length:339 start_codon:yes stop_codon:yes gene_type:complete